MSTKEIYDELGGVWGRTALHVRSGRYRKVSDAENRSALLNMEFNGSAKT